jgi:hypothetical protein
MPASAELLRRERCRRATDHSAPLSLSTTDDRTGLLRRESHFIFVGSMSFTSRGALSRVAKIDHAPCSHPQDQAMSNNPAPVIILKCDYNAIVA